MSYAYTQMSGGSNDSRPAEMTYPNGRVLKYEYAGLDSAIGRITGLKDRPSSASCPFV